MHQQSRSIPAEERTDSVGPLSRLADLLAPSGLILRGGFYPEPGEAGLEEARTVVLLGNAGPAMWAAFEAHSNEMPDPLDRWTKRIADSVAAEVGARAVYPFGAGAPPFQRWALRAETLYISPLGILIHPVYGLWHAYRAALLFDEALPLPQSLDTPSPCDTCEERPCLSACPVGAFTPGRYDVAACAAHIATEGANCLDLGCHARNACPVGRQWRYPEQQIRFHMTAFARVVGRTATGQPSSPRTPEGAS